MLSLSNVHRSYTLGKSPPVHVLRGVSLEIEAAQTYSIRGKSGCGKSTLLHLMGGLDTPNQGEVLWQKQNVAQWSSPRRARWRGQSVGFVFQSYHLLHELTVLENVLLPSAFSRKNFTDQGKTILDLVGLRERMHHRASELSGGEKQRTAIARALIHDPAVILADEPTGNLDEENARSVADLLLDLVQQKKKALVIVTHDEALADRAQHRLRLKEGLLETIE